jgi:LPXTG-motif cell wall-anchored protein
MRNSFMRKGFTAVVVTVVLLMVMTANAFAATTYIVKDGAFQNAGFINAGNVVDGTIQGPGNWTQLNFGDAAVDAPYLHIIMKAAGGDTALAQIGVSDLYTFNLADLGVTLTEEYQDVVLPVSDNGIEMLSWINCMGLDGGTVTYTIKDAFLSDDANSTLAAVATEETPAVDVAADTATDTAEADVPKTGENGSIAVIAMLCMAGSAIGYVALRKNEKSL